jgi:hypothetical protein
MSVVHLKPLYLEFIAKAIAYRQLENKKKQSTQDSNKYLQKQIEVGDIVHKVTNKTISKFYEREGKVVEVSYNRSKVLWDKRTTIEYEFNDNLKVIRMGKDSLTKEKKYVIMLIGSNKYMGIFETYNEAEIEAKNLVNRQQLPAYILESVAYVEITTPKVTKL